MRIVGVDRIPATPFDRGEAPRKPVLTPIQLRTRKAKRALAARGMVEAVTWSFIAKPQAELFGGGKPELALANPDRVGPLRHAAEPHSGLLAAAPEERRPRLGRRGAVRGRTDLPRRPPGGPAHRGRRRAPRAGESRPASAATGRRPRPRSMPSTPRPTRSRCSSPPARRRRRCRSSRAGRPGCIPGAPARSRSGRRTSSAISASCIRARSRRSMPKARWSPSR